MIYPSLFLIIATFLLPTAVISATVDFGKFLRNYKDKNPDLKNAIQQVLATQERSNAIYSLYIPSLTMGQSYSLTKPVPASGNTYDLSKTLSQSLGIVGAVPQMGLIYSSNLINQSGSSYFLNNEKRSETNSGLIDFGLSLKLLKGLGPAIGNLPFSRADVNKKLAEQEKIQTLLSGVGQLISAYNNVFATINNLRISNGIFATNESDVKKAEQQHKEGVIPYLSLLSLQSQHTNLKRSILGIRKNLRENLLSLYNLSGIQYTEEDLANLEFMPIRPSANFGQSITQWLSEPLSMENLKNPQLLIKKLNLQLAEFDIKQAKNNALPDVSLNAKLIQNTDRRHNYYPYEGNTKEYSITLSMPIGLVSERAELTARNIEMKARLNDYEQTQLRLKQSWSNLGQQYRLSLEQLEITKQLVEVAKKQYQSSLPTATLGSTYQANIINFQNQLLNAQLELNQAQADLLNLMVQIYVLKGEPSFIKLLE
jgi:outer membrane protein TolC